MVAAYVINWVKIIGLSTQCVSSDQQQSEPSHLYIVFPGVLFWILFIFTSTSRLASSHGLRLGRSRGSASTRKAAAELVTTREMKTRPRRVSHMCEENILNQERNSSPIICSQKMLLIHYVQAIKQTRNHSSGYSQCWGEVNKEESK